MNDEKHDIENQEREEILERLSRAIQTCEAIHNDSRTPLDHALRLMDHIRDLHRFRRALRRIGFSQATASTEYADAIETLKVLNETIKTEVMAHKRTMEFVNSVAQAVTAVLDLAIKVGALAA